MGVFTTVAVPSLALNVSQYGELGNCAGCRARGWGQFGAESPADWGEGCWFNRFLPVCTNKLSGKNSPQAQIN